MLSEKVQKAINEQIKKEAYSSNLYLAMASWAEVKGFKGSADFLYVQAEEERLHMLMLFKHVNERDGFAEVSELEKPPIDFASIKGVFEDVLKHEKYISKSINDLVGVCYDERDFTSINFLQWFVNEQIEEEANARAILDRLELLGNDKTQLYIFDRDINTIRQQNATTNKV
jgi:ferritin